MEFDAFVDFSITFLAFAAACNRQHEFIHASGEKTVHGTYLRGEHFVFQEKGLHGSADRLSLNISEESPDRLQSTIPYSTVGSGWSPNQDRAATFSVTKDAS